MTSGMKSTREEEDLKRMQELEEANMKQNKDLQKLKEENRNLRDKCVAVQATKEQMMNEIEALEILRKQQQQQIISLKGNMRVYCRVKPME